VSDRLEEFRRQRGVLRAHLEWLDREIAALDGAAPEQAPPEVPPAPAGPALADAEAILAEYRRPPVSIQKQAKVGCLLYFVALLALMALAVGVLYVFVKRAHGH